MSNIYNTHRFGSWNNNLGNIYLDETEMDSTIYQDGLPKSSLIFDDRRSIVSPLIAQIKQLDSEKKMAIEKYAIYAFNLVDFLDELIFEYSTSNYKSPQVSNILRSILLQTIDFKPEYLDLLTLAIKLQGKTNSLRVDLIRDSIISEVQVAAGGWSIAYKFIQSRRLLHSAVSGFLDTFANLDNRKNLFFLVNRSISQYWLDFIDFANILRRETGMEGNFYVISDHHLTYSQDNYIVARFGNKEIPIDNLYLVGDAQRNFFHGNFGMLASVTENKVNIQPTLNPLVNNYQLVTALLTIPEFEEIFIHCLGESFRIFDNSIKYKVLTEESIFDKSDVIIRSLLTRDLKKLSSGYGMRQGKNISREEINRLAKGSGIVFDDVRKGMCIEDELLGYAKYLPSLLEENIKILNPRNQKKSLLINPRYRTQVLFSRDIRDNGLIKYLGGYRTYCSKASSSFQLGGPDFSIGGINI